MPVPQILIIEDDSAINDVYRRMFQRDGYLVTVADHGELGLAIAESQNPDLIVLDIGLPDMSGYEICRRLRQYNACSNIPIVFVSGQGSSAACITSFEIGGDDFVVKPFHLEELRARIRARLRRYQQLHEIQSASLTIDTITGDAHVHGKVIRLSSLGQQLLGYLIKHAGHPCTNAQLIRDVWRYRVEDTDPNLVRWQISALRKRIEQDPKKPQYIHTIKQRGYMYWDPAQGDLQSYFQNQGSH
jgi:DNA-binding response OmpR family regulator